MQLYNESMYVDIVDSKSACLLTSFRLNSYNTTDYSLSYMKFLGATLIDHILPYMQFFISRSGPGNFSRY
jgi:hypothetical protein